MAYLSSQAVFQYRHGISGLREPKTIVKSTADGILKYTPRWLMEITTQTSNGKKYSALLISLDRRGRPRHVEVLVSTVEILLPTQLIACYVRLLHHAFWVLG